MGCKSFASFSLHIALAEQARLACPVKVDERDDCKDWLSSSRLSNALIRLLFQSCYSHSICARTKSAYRFTLPW